MGVGQGQAARDPPPGAAQLEQGHRGGLACPSGASTSAEGPRTAASHSARTTRSAISGGASAGRKSAPSGPATASPTSGVPPGLNAAATTEALTGPAPKVAESKVIDCWAPPLTDTRISAPTRPDRSNCGALAPAAVPVLVAAVPSLSGALDSRISASGPPTSAGRFPWKSTRDVCCAGSVSDVGTVMKLPVELTMRRPVRESTSARLASIENEPTRE